MTNTERDYWNTVKAIATDTREEYPNPDDDERQGYIWESVDGSEWIVYYANNETVLNATNNHDAIDEVGPETSSFWLKSDWKRSRMTCAFYAMLQDVNDALSPVGALRLTQNLIETS